MTTTHININSADYRSTHTVRQPIAKRMRQLRESIAIIRTSGGNPEAYEKALKGLRCPTCGNEGDCPDCGAEQ